MIVYLSVHHIRRTWSLSQKLSGDTSSNATSNRNYYLARDSGLKVRLLKRGICVRYSEGESRSVMTVVTNFRVVYNNLRFTSRGVIEWTGAFMDRVPFHSAVTHELELVEIVIIREIFRAHPLGQTAPATVSTEHAIKPGNLISTRIKANIPAFQKCERIAFLKHGIRT